MVFVLLVFGVRRAIATGVDSDDAGGDKGTSEQPPLEAFGEKGRSGVGTAQSGITISTCRGLALVEFTDTFRLGSGNSETLGE
jgi:hypothetical protein